ncbi:MAG TPA: ring-opening amidohydrolase [Albitalea sp.]|nr:ring-opening amidohydrolase [Albitalea sp.]
MLRCDAFHLLTSGPGDVAGLAALIDAGTLDPAHIVAVLGKTEGNGCVNDFTREYATVALVGLLSQRLGIDAAAVHRRVAFVMSGGTEGVLSPHLTVFTRRPATQAAPAGAKRLSIGVAFTRDFLPEEIGRSPQVHETALAVRAAMQDAAIADAADLHFVQVKCPLLSSQRIAAARERGRDTATVDSYESMALSRGASALGVAVATGEVDAGRVHDGVVLRDTSLASSVASASAGIELLHNVVVVLGMSAHACSPFVIGHDVMRDAIDAAAVRRALSALDIADGDAAQRIVNVFAKSEASPDGTVRGARHTMLNDSDLHSTRHARAAVGAVIASVVGRTAVYVSGGAEHQGPPGGGPVAVVARA